MLYNLKAIGVVPPATDFIDIVLSKTQRGTPTVVHKGTWRLQIRYWCLPDKRASGLLICGDCVQAGPSHGSGSSTRERCAVLMDLAAHSSASYTDATNLPWGPLQVKFTQQNWHDRLTAILDDFPKVRQGSTQRRLRERMHQVQCAAGVVH